MLITLDPITAEYLSIPVADPWMRSVGYQDYSTSLTNFQAKANADGSFTYIIALQDHGIPNWLDARGLHDGLLLVRWELLSVLPQVDKAVRIVKLPELASILPVGTPQASSVASGRIDRSQRGGSSRKWPHAICWNP